MFLNALGLAEIYKCRQGSETTLKHYILLSCICVILYVCVYAMLYVMLGSQYMYHNCLCAIVLCKFCCSKLLNLSRVVHIYVDTLCIRMHVHFLCITRMQICQEGHILSSIC